MSVGSLSGCEVEFNYEDEVLYEPKSVLSEC
jgi:hypothetical protein